MFIGRYLEAPVRADLDAKIVLLAGPRQVGKTTIAKHLLADEASGVYLSWDRRDDRRTILRGEWPPGRPLVVLDELHKYRQWKRFIKGEYDQHHERVRFLVTGSARLDVYRRGGDSLLGRYHHYRLHPFTVAEVIGRSSGSTDRIAPGSELALPRGRHAETLEALMRFGGFPEPYTAESERALRRWQKARLDAFFREDVRELEAVRDLSSIELLAELLRARVGSLLSLNALREDLDVSHRAVTHWLDVLERLYFVFRVRPHGGKGVRTLKKMPKAYLWDWTLVEDRAARFENLVAVHLLKLCHFLEDVEGHKMDLRYLRDPGGREVDFLVTCDGKPWFAVEAKVSDSDLHPHLRYFQARLPIPWAFQAVLDGRRDVIAEGVRILPADVLLAGLV